MNATSSSPESKRAGRAPAGFVLLTHQHPEQVVRLVDVLTEMFDAPPIVCHHDFSKCALPRERFGPHVAFVTPHLETSWAHYSVVEATGRAIAQLFAEPSTSPEWFVVLSGSDYPIQTAATILRDLAASGYDAHIGHERIDARVFDDAWVRSYWERKRPPGTHAIDPGACYGRYRTVSIPIPTWRGMTSRTLYKPIWNRPFLPFSRNFHCYAGSQWFCGNARAARRIVEFRNRDRRLVRHYRDRKFSEESYFQTILANDPELKLSEDNLRYTDWSARGSHPKTLDLGDLPALQQSSAHFARKLEPVASGSLMDALDEWVGVRGARKSVRSV